MNSHCKNLQEQAACWCAPAEFVRPKFFYGQRLGVVDFSDWLWYHAGKQRFHNLTSHGVGVLCGLRAELYSPSHTESTTLLTITRGAAYDACGREVIVPVNQCIDVAAWFIQHGEDDDVTAWIGSDAPHRLCVGLRYRECPSDPAPAPRDPCGCDSGGCEYARVREGFELRLFPATSPVLPAEATVATCQPYHDLLQALATGAQDPADECAALRQVLHGLVPPECPPPSSDSWLWLACLDVTLVEDRTQVTAIGEPDNTIPQRLELLGTAVLQEMLLRLAANAATAGLLGVGPRFSDISFDAKAIGLGIELYTAPGASTPTPLAADTIKPEYFRLHRLAPPETTPFQPMPTRPPATPMEAIGAASSRNAERPSKKPSGDLTRPDLSWNEVVLKRKEGVQYDQRNSQILVQPGDSLKPGNYRITVTSPPAAPIVDISMRPLMPLTYARNFRLRSEGVDGGLVLEPVFG